METIKDIVREMRKDIPRVVDAKVILRNYADRLEAAHKRELEDAIAATVKAAAQSASEVYEPHIQSEPVGNAAKMREALEAINRIDTRGLKRLLYELVEADIFDGGQINKTISAVENARRALSAPARNCDLYATPKEAGEAFISESCENPCENCTVSDECHNPLIHECGINWLFAEAKGEKK